MQIPRSPINRNMGRYIVLHELPIIRPQLTIIYSINSYVSFSKVFHNLDT